MYHIIYLSTAVKLFSPDELRDLLIKSKKYNSKNDISGCLFYKDGSFLQVIEGEKSTVRNLMGKICLDPRHKGIITLFNEEISDRKFPNWEMALHDFSNMPKKIPEGFSDIFFKNPKTIIPDQYPLRIKEFLKFYI